MIDGRDEVIQSELCVWKCEAIQCNGRQGFETSDEIIAKITDRSAEEGGKPGNRSMPGGKRLAGAMRTGPAKVFPVPDAGSDKIELGPLPRKE